METNIMQEYEIIWRHVGQRRHLSPSLQSRIATTIVEYAGHFPITVECLLHNGVEGINGNVIPVPTSTGMKIVLIEDGYILLFRLEDILPNIQ